MYWKGFWWDDDLSEEDTLPFHVTLHQTIFHHLWCCTVWWPPPEDILLGHRSRQARSPAPLVPLSARSPRYPWSQIPAELELLRELTLGQGLCCAGSVPPVEFGNYAVWDVTTTAGHRKALLSRASVRSFQCTPLCQLVSPWAVPCVWWCCSPVAPEQISNSWSWGWKPNALVMVYSRLHKDSSHGLGTNEIGGEGLVPLKGLRWTSKTSGLNHVLVSWHMEMQSEAGTLEVQPIQKRNSLCTNGLHTLRTDRIYLF